MRQCARQPADRSRQTLAAAALQEERLGRKGKAGHGTGGIGQAWPELASARKVGVLGSQSPAPAALPDGLAEAQQVCPQLPSDAGFLEGSPGQAPPATRLLRAFGKGAAGDRWAAGEFGV